MAQTNKSSHIGLNIDDTDAARVAVLEQKRRIIGLQDSEKEELKQLYEKGRRPI
jgi:hypothetical protein